MDGGEDSYVIPVSSLPLCSSCCLTAYLFLKKMACLEVSETRTSSVLSNIGLKICLCIYLQLTQFQFCSCQWAGIALTNGAASDAD